MKSIISEKGQVTIPKPLREKLGLRPGVVLDFTAQRGTLVARKSVGPKNPVDAVTGILPPMDVDAEIEIMRGKAWIPPRDRPRANRR
jgi:antitoxin PrlF